MMKKLLAIVMLGIFLASITCAIPVTAAHQKDILDGLSLIENSIKNPSKNDKVEELKGSVPILGTLLDILKTIIIWILIVLKLPIKLMVLILNAIIKAIDLLIVLLS